MEDFKVALRRVQPTAKREGFAMIPNVTWADIGALKDVREQLENSILRYIKYPEYYNSGNITKPCGILLAGPPGCGKTLLAKVIANETGLNFLSVKGPELINKYLGESEHGIRQVFQRARTSAPCVIFFDELDAICPKRSDSSSGENTSARVVNQMLTEMDGFDDARPVFVIGATNRPGILDDAILRPGRLDKIVFVNIPTADERYDILMAITKGGERPALESDVDLNAIARDPRCEGFTSADLAAVVKEASDWHLTELLKANPDSNSHEAFTMLLAERHFEAALDRIKPSVTPQAIARYANLKMTFQNQHSKIG